MFIRRLSGAYCGGVSGALTSLGVLWLLGRSGLLTSLEIGVRADLSLGGLYRLVVWGGIWGLPLLLPFWRGTPLRRGAFLSLVPSATILLYFYPRIGRGYLGVEYGVLTPLLIVFLSLLWGVVAALWLRSSGG